tara:strand:- start:377 stop:2110 length:1734 start_codon:yes stop_codon:yes gene_type:complete
LKFLINLNSNQSPELIKFSYSNELENFFTKNISNINKFKKSINDNKRNFFNWFYKNSDFDSKYWWMTSIFMKNNLSNHYFDNLSYISFLDELITENKINNKIIVIERDYLALDFCNLLRKRNVNFKVSKLDYFITKFNFKLKNFFIILLNILKFLFDFNYSLFLSKLINPKLTINLNNHIKIFHLCLSKKDILSKNPIECDYFKDIPDISDSNYFIYKLPWIVDSNIISKLTIFKKINDKNIINPYQFINFKFQFYILKQIYNCFRYVNFSKTYKNFDIRSLLNSYKFKNTSFLLQNYIFWSYELVINKFHENKNVIKFYDPFHMGISEVIQKSIHFREKVEFNGYYHSFCSDSILGYHFTNKEINSKFFPDKIILNVSNNLNKKSISIFNKKSIYGPAIRQKDILSQKYELLNINKYDLLFLLPLNKSFEDEIIYLFKIYSNYLSNFKIAIKFHPKSNRNIHTISLDENLNYDFIKNDLISAINTSKIIITVCSSSFIDALLLGRISLTYSPSFTLDWDFKELEQKYGKNFKINMFNFQEIISNINKNYEVEKTNFQNIAEDLKKYFNIRSDVFLS